MPITDINIETAYCNTWTKCFVDSKLNQTNAYPPPLNIVRSKKETAKLLGFESYKALLQSDRLTAGEMRTKSRYNGKRYMTIPVDYEMCIYKPNIDTFIRKEFNNEFPFPAACVFIDHLIIHEFCHFVYDSNLYRELIHLHQTDDELVSYKQLAKKFDELYIEHHQHSGRFDDEKRTEKMTLKLLRELYGVDMREIDDDGFTLIMPRYNSHYITTRGINSGIDGGINHNEANVVHAMLRYFELTYLLTYEYADVPGSAAYNEAYDELRDIIKYIRQYSFENDDLTEFV